MALGESGVGVDRSHRVEQRRLVYLDVLDLLFEHQQSNMEIVDGLEELSMPFFRSGSNGRGCEPLDHRTRALHRWGDAGSGSSSDSHGVEDNFDAVWNGQTLAVVLPTYNEAGSIADCIRGFEALKIVDDIVVVNNNAHPDTSPEVATTSAREVYETIQGYGAAIRRGIAETSDADLVCVCEPDGTFDPGDLLKLLPFTTDVSIVFGSRTVQTFILSGANMGWFLRWGNWAVAKLTEVLYNTVYLSDVGCTFRVVRRDALDRLQPNFVGTGSAFGYEMMLLAARLRLPLVQVPVKYQPRVGTSSVTGDHGAAVRLGLRMIAMCVRERIVPRRLR